jgi:hypothetical protein
MREAVVFRVMGSDVANLVATINVPSPSTFICYIKSSSDVSSIPRTFHQ